MERNERGLQGWNKPGMSSWVAVPLVPILKKKHVKYSQQYSDKITPSRVDLIVKRKQFS
jgi:hypothetical protein